MTAIEFVKMVAALTPDRECRRCLKDGDQPNAECRKHRAFDMESDAAVPDYCLNCSYGLSKHGPDQECCDPNTTDREELFYMQRQAERREESTLPGWDGRLHRAVGEGLPGNMVIHLDSDPRNNDISNLKVVPFPAPVLPEEITRLIEHNEEVKNAEPVIDPNIFGEEENA